MKNNFIENINDEKYFYSLIEDLENSKVGFYSVGLYPASLAYNCAMHGKSNNILLAKRILFDLPCIAQLYANDAGYKPTL